MSEFSEYGGEGGLIQPDLGDPRLPPAAQEAGLGHSSEEARAADRKGVRDAAMVVRSAGLAEARGEVVETVIDEETGVATYVQYDEAAARERLSRERS